jgi:spermidine synthase
MIPFEFLDSAKIPGNSEELRLYKRGNEFLIMVGNYELMNSRVHGSEDALGELACKKIAGRPGVNVLIGGLGMGYTVAAALKQLVTDARIVVAELVPTVVEWNRGALADLAGHPLDNSRVNVQEIDVAKVLRAERGAYDAILLDVDNGPVGLTRQRNDWLYTREGLNAAFAALRPNGILAVWSASSDRTFLHRLRRVGFKVEEVSVRARGSRGSRHTIWLAERKP